MNLMTLLRRSGMSASASVVLAIFTGCAHGTPPAAPEATASAPAAAPAAASAASATAPAAPAIYNGRFVSECNTLDDGLNYNDVMELSQQGNTVTAQYIKVFYATANCAPDTVLAHFYLPVTRWDIQGSVTVGGQKVERVVVTLQAGKLRAQAAPKGKITETDDTIVLHYGKDARIPVTRATEGSVDKDLRMVKGDKLYIGDAEAPLIGGYPSALHPNMVFTRQ